MSGNKKKKFGETMEVVESMLEGGGTGAVIGTAVGAGLGGGLPGAIAGGIVGGVGGASQGEESALAAQAEREAVAAEKEAEVMDEALEIHAEGGVTGPEAIAQARENQR